MSRRTSEACKAIREAWGTEQLLVLEGKGTRDWTPEQQQSIIDKGKAYDDDGKAFEGHHMKSAEAYPGYQGHAKNIQFLSRTEHQEAHGGSYRNPTNGYYDPETHLTIDFGENIYVPCEVIALSNPVTCLRFNELIEEKSLERKPEKKDAEQRKAKKNVLPVSDKVGKEVMKKSKEVGHKSGFGIGIKLRKAADAVIDFGVKHPTIVKVAKWSGLTVLSAYVGKAAYDSGKSNGGEDYSSASDSTDDYDSTPDELGSDDTAFERDYQEKRSSPREHTVSGYDRQRNGRSEHIDSYPRGGNKE